MSQIAWNYSYLTPKQKFLKHFSTCLVHVLHSYFLESFVFSCILTSPFNSASLSLASTTATFSPLGVFSAMSTEVSDVMSNTGLLSFSSKMVIETCWDIQCTVTWQSTPCQTGALPTLESINQKKVFKTKEWLTFCTSNVRCNK